MVMGGLIPARYKGVEMSKYFKKPIGVLIENDESTHDLKSLEERFEECNADGSKPKPKKAKKDDK